jgi:hypothetical protein
MDMSNHIYWLEERRRDQPHLLYSVIPLGSRASPDNTEIEPP